LIAVSSSSLSLSWNINSHDSGLLSSFVMRDLKVRFSKLGGPLAQIGLGKYLVYSRVVVYPLMIEGRVITEQGGWGVEEEGE